MPTITRLFIKTALLYLLSALILETVSAFQGGAAWHAVTIVQFHLLAVGWLTQMVFGVGYWLFPMRLPLDRRDVLVEKSPTADRMLRRPSRGPQWPLAIAYAFLNVGLIARAICEPLFAAGRLPHGGGILAASGGLQFAAAALFTWQVWPRIRERA